MTSETWQLTLNDLLWEWLHYSSIRKKEEIFSESTEELQRKERNKMSNLKCWKSKDISSSKQIFRETQWQVKTLRNRAEEKTDETDKSYIILMRVKDHLWFRINSTITYIKKNLRKASRIRKIKERSDSNIITEYIRITYKSIKTN